MSNTTQQEKVVKYITYKISRTDGKPLDPASQFFVLRLDKGSEKNHRSASIKAYRTYADNIRWSHPILADEIYKHLETLEKDV